MKITALVEHMKKALGIAERSVGKNTHLPVLESFLMKAEAGKVEVSATNLETGIVTSFPAKIEEEGSVAVAAHSLEQFAHQLADVKVVMVSDDKTLSLVTDSYRASVPTFAVGEFPLIPDVKDGDGFQIESALFARSLEQVSIASSASDFRPELESVMLRIHPEEGLVLAATDTFRLAEKRLGKSDVMATARAPRSCLVPVRTVKDVVRIAKEKLDPVNVRWDANQVVFQWPDTRLVSRVLEGEFPEYASVIPKEFNASATVHHGKLMESLRVSGVFSSRLNDVRFTIKPSKKIIALSSSDSLSGANDAQVAVESAEGKEITAPFDYRYLIDVLGVLDSRRPLTISLTDAERPAFIRQEGDNSYFYILMPLRI